MRPTPLVKGPNCGLIEVYYKLDCLQPSGSFKDRGIGHMIRTLISESSVEKLICSSGGNAGLAVATVALEVKLPCDIYVPITTLPMMLDKLRCKGANVIIGGANWNEADLGARKALKESVTYKYIPPFDHTLIFEGHGSVVDELLEELGVEGFPDTIVLSVGGGGLLRGVQLGLERLNLNSRVKILAVETTGTASFAAAKKHGSVVRLDKIESVASSLGALAVTPAVLTSSVETISVVITDAEAVAACLRFADDRRILVEPACGAALSVGYMVPERVAEYVPQCKRMAVIVCGGSAVSLQLLNDWKLKFNL